MSKVLLLICSCSFSFQSFQTNAVTLTATAAHKQIINNKAFGEDDIDYSTKKYINSQNDLRRTNVDGTRFKPQSHLEFSTNIPAKQGPPSEDKRAKFQTFKNFMYKNRNLLKFTIGDKQSKPVRSGNSEERSQPVQSGLLATSEVPSYRAVFGSEGVEGVDRPVRRFGEPLADGSRPDSGQLDMAPAKGARIETMRLKGRLCQRSVLFPEGPKYDSRGRAYLRAHVAAHAGGRDFAATKPRRLLLPRCCNCCKKSVLGCE